LVVNDGKIDSAVTSVSVTATTANAAPVANAGNNQNVTIGTTVTLDGTASSDANNDSLTYKWTLLNKPTNSNAALSSGTSAKPTFTADIAGVYVFSLQVNDGKVDSAVVTVSVTASAANVAPVANAGANQSVVLGTVTLDASTSSDANNDTLTYKWALLSKPTNSNAVLAAATSAKPTFTADTAGVYVFSLQVNDGKLDSTNTSTVTVTAAAANAAPVANAGSVQTVSRSSGTITVTLNATGSTDANGDTLTYRWAVAYQPPTSSITLSSTTTASPTFAATVAGVYVFTLVVNDGKIDSAAATVSITVN
jgi:hypothetical protein